MDATPPVPLAALVGLDWGTEHHAIALQASGSTTVEAVQLDHTPEAIVAWLRTLAQRFGGAKIGVALETSRGPIVHALLEAPFVVLYPVNPRSLCRFRETFTPSGAKDDAPDARLLLRLLTHHRDRLPPWTPDDTATRTLARLVQQRRAVVDQRTQVTQRLRAALQEYYPLALTVTGDDLSAPMACAFLLRWPTLAALQRARPATVRAFYTTHHGRSAVRIAARLAAIATAQPLTTDPAIIDPTALYVQVLVRQLQAVHPGLVQLETTIAATFAAHPEAALFAALPGAGAAFAPRLLVAFGTDRTRFPTAADVQRAAGIAPITIRSGKSGHTHRRWAASNFLRQTFHEFAQYSLPQVAWARAFYHVQRQRGKSHHTAIRSLAFKWIRILWRCWHDHTPYDDARYVRALTERHSPLSTHLAAA